MSHGMLFTFISAVVAYLRAQSANVSNQAAIQTHQLSSSSTHGRTFHIQLNALCHFLHIRFIETFGRTVITYCHTAQASIYASLKLMVAHGSFCHSKGD